MILCAMSSEWPSVFSISLICEGIECLPFSVDPPSLSWSFLYCIFELLLVCNPPSHLRNGSSCSWGRFSVGRSCGEDSKYSYVICYASPFMKWAYFLVPLFLENLSCLVNILLFEIQGSIFQKFRHIV